MNKQIKKPWGTYEVLYEDDKCKVKKIVIKPKQSLSYQYHKHRDEHWFGIEGNGMVIMDKYRDSICKGKSFDIIRGELHKVSNLSVEKDCVFIEIQTGDELDEEDIIRIDDQYGRTGVVI